MASDKTIYDAPGEYMKDVRTRSGPRNVPAHIMGQMRGAAINQLVGTPSAQAAAHAGFNGDIAKWNTYAKETKMEKVIQMEDVEQLRAAMIMETDNDMLQFMLDHKIAMETKTSS